jgi:2-C-methyl-D-erythritol 4-phosphate cytidylyltransferase / 2-C-methyl-D-erythritol 2,4-cyclodiphosphate synthase
LLNRKQGRFVTVTIPKIAALIVAAGRGHRAGGDIPKQYRDLHGEAVLRRTLRAFLSHPAISHVMVVIHPDDQDLFDRSVDQMDVSHCFGADSRTGSVRNGVNALATQIPDRILVHDGARPFVSARMIDRLCAALDSHSAAVPGLPVTDATFTRLQDGLDVSVDRETLVRVQTPQAFDFQTLKHCLDALSPDQIAADEASLLRSAGIPVHIVDGDPANIKLTFAEDFAMMENGLTVYTSSGTGYDVHRLGPGDGVTLCGVRIPCDLALIGHSDADVGLHALTDAILGAIGEGDIGQHFPPSDPQWKGAASSAFVTHAAGLVAAANARITHADMTLVCEQPKIGPHRTAMRETICRLLELPPRSVNIKATTTEGLGFTGRGEGVAAHAIVTVMHHD